MRPFAMISSSIWRSKKFRKLRSDSARLAYFFLHSHEGGNSLGAFHMPPEQAALGMKRDAEDLIEAYAELQGVNLIRYDEEEELLYIVGFVTHSPPQSYKHLSGLNRIFKGLPEGPIKSEIAAEIMNALEAKAAEWSDEVTSKSVFLSTAMFLRDNYPSDTPIHTPIIEAAADTPIHTPTDTQDNTDTETETIKKQKPDDDVDDEPTERELLLVAMGHDKSGMTANGRLVGKQGDMAVFQKWRAELGLTFDEIVGVISEVSQSPSYPAGGPFSFNFFGSEMAKLAAIKSAPPLTPDQGAQNGRPPRNQATSHSRAKSGGIADRAERLRGARFVDSQAEAGATGNDGGGEGSPSLDHGAG